MNALVYFHQGWTDIINCLALINVFAERYATVFVLLREDAAPLIELYIRGISNAVPIYRSKSDLDTTNIQSLVDFKSLAIDVAECIGNHDNMRHPYDPYRGSYQRYPQPTFAFERLFYESYDIPYIERIQKFQLIRDLEAEDAMYASLIKDRPYICIHTNPEIGDIDRCQDKVVIELNQSSSVFFDMIKVLQNASEIRLIDSVWAAVCYQLDAKYGLFSHIPITIYCYRKFDRMFCEPVRLPNWTLRTMHS